MITNVAIIGAIVFFSLRYPQYFRRHGTGGTIYPPHDYTSATHASPEYAAAAQDGVDVWKQIGMLQTLSLSGNKVIFTVGPYWNAIPQTAQDMDSYVNTALDWGRITTNRVRDVDFVDSNGNLLATYEPVAGVKFIRAATQPTSAPTTRE